jgi:hypothetical protein
MATIANIIIGVISLLGKWNMILPREVFWWLVGGREHLMVFFSPKAPRCALGGGVLSSGYVRYSTKVEFPNFSPSFY